MGRRTGQVKLVRSLNADDIGKWTRIAPERGGKSEVVRIAALGNPGRWSRSVLFVTTEQRRLRRNLWLFRAVPVPTKRKPV